MVSEHDDPPRRLDLDALIGDIRREGARRRAEPGFPLDVEARLGIESARQAPRPVGPALEDLAEAAASLAQPAASRAQPAASRAQPAASRAQPAASGAQPAASRAQPAASKTQPAASKTHPDGSSEPAGPIGRTRNLAASVLRRPPADAPGVATLAGIMARALRVSAALLVDLDRRLRVVEGRDEPAPSWGDRPSAGPAADLAPWTARLGEHLRPEAGRVLCIGVEPELLVAGLREQHIDAYGVTPVGERYRTQADVRHGDPLEHLKWVGSDGLGAVVVVGGAMAAFRPGLPAFATELARVTRTVLVVSEAPWWWAQRVGPREAHLAGGRPYNAETWLDVLDRSGFVGSAEYGGSGRSYLVAAARRR